MYSQQIAATEQQAKDELAAAGAAEASRYEAQLKVLEANFTKPMAAFVKVGEVKAAMALDAKCKAIADKKNAELRTLQKCMEAAVLELQKQERAARPARTVAEQFMADCARRASIEVEKKNMIDDMRKERSEFMRRYRDLRLPEDLDEYHAMRTRLMEPWPYSGGAVIDIDPNSEDSRTSLESKGSWLDEEVCIEVKALDGLTEDEVNALRKGE